MGTKAGAVKYADVSGGCFSLLWKCDSPGLRPQREDEENEEAGELFLLVSGRIKNWPTSLFFILSS